MILIFLGPPGSGKGTQAKQWSSRKKWPQLSTGDMLRANISEGTRLGLEAKKNMDEGKLVPDHVVVGMIDDRIQKEDCQGGFILDGFPRTIPQAESLDALLKAKGKSVDKAIEFKVDDSFLIDRLTGRRTCIQCSTMYHIVTSPPVQDGICDRCGSPVVQRNDDQIGVIKKRLEVYHQQTEPLISYYREQFKLATLDASQTVEKVSDKLGQILK